MAKQYTKCVAPEDYSGWAGPVAITAIVGIALALITGMWMVLGPTAMAALIAFCEWWLYGRLVCLRHDECAVGGLLTTEPPGEKSGFEAFDTDFSINLVLPGHTINDTKQDVETDGALGYLIAEQPETKNQGLGFVGYTSRQYQNRPNTPVLHAEFEGGGIYDLYQAAKIAFAVLAVGTVACAIPIIGWIACAIALVVAAIIAIVAIIVALNDTGHPSDANAELTELHTPDEAGYNGDVLLVKGDWVYDSLHDGWNEIHPILYAQRIGTWSSWSRVEASRDHWCEEVGKASDPLTVENQGRDENQWVLHPVIDGCAPRETEPPSRPDIR